MSKSVNFWDIKEWSIMRCPKTGLLNNFFFDDWVPARGLKFEKRPYFCNFYDFSKYIDTYILIKFISIYIPLVVICLSRYVRLYLRFAKIFD